MHSLGGVLAVTIGDTTIDPIIGVGGSALGAFAATLVVGAILVALAPDWTRRAMQTGADEPIESILLGLVLVVGFGIGLFVLVLSIIGILVAIPLIILATILWSAGSAVGFLAIANRLVDTSEDWLAPLVLAATLSGLLTLSAIGGLLSGVVGLAGVGALWQSR